MWIEQRQAEISADETRLRAKFAAMPKLATSAVHGL
jgi:hypothetical protein